MRFTYDNNYFNARYQGIPNGGYNRIIEKLLVDCDVEINVDFIRQRDKYKNIANKIIFTGAIDNYFDYKFG